MNAMSHPIRIYILDLPSNQTCCYSSDLAESLSIAPSTLSQHLKELKNAGLICTLGSIISYTLLGMMIYYSAGRLDISIFFQKYLNKFLGPLLILIGLFMLDIFKLGYSGGGKWINTLKEKINTGRSRGALTLGMLFASAFCPYSARLYFGMLIPITIKSVSGLYLPVIFAIATGLPVIIFAWLVAFTVRGARNSYQNLKTFELWFRRIVAIVFILTGFYYSRLIYIKPLNFMGNGRYINQ